MNTRPLISRRKREDETFDEAFVKDISEGAQYADALKRHVTGNSKIRRAVALQTLQAIAGLQFEDLSGLLVWAKSQSY